MQNPSIALLATVILALVNPVEAQSLKGSRASMQRQNSEAVKYGYDFMQTSQAISRFVDSGYLVKVQENRHFDLHDVSYPYARPAVRMFVERLSEQYHTACGEKMTVTSLTRPIDRQPANAASDSVHPTGMAVDLRIPSKQNCRSWLERTLLDLEAEDVLDVTREHHPPHYHVAVFTQTYETYIASLAEPQTPHEYVVRRGDSLSLIASKTGASIAQLRAHNGLTNDMIRVGQKLQVPSSAPAAVPTDTPRAETVASAEPVTATTEVAAAATEVSHRVRRGETLWRIANLYGTSVNLLRRDNSLANDVLHVGQVLRVLPKLQRDVSQQ